MTATVIVSNNKPHAPVALVPTYTTQTVTTQNSYVSTRPKLIAQPMYQQPPPMFNPEMQQQYGNEGIETEEGQMNAGVTMY